MKLFAIALTLITSANLAQATPIFYHRKFKQAYKIADQALDRALEQSEQLKALDVYESVLEVKKNLRRAYVYTHTATLNPFISCSGIYGMHNPNSHHITLCRSILKHSPTSIAQNFIHEAIHFTGNGDECYTTQVQYTIALLAGWDAFMNGYFNWKDNNFACKSYGEFAPNWTQWLSAQTNIRTREEFMAWVLRTKTANKPFTSWEKILLDPSDLHRIGTFVNKPSAISGMTALMIAVRKGKRKWVNVLLEVPGIDLSLRSYENKTALDYATEAGYKRIRSSLLSHTEQED